MYMIELGEEKYEELSENVEKALRCIGKVMQCVETIKNSSNEEEEYEPVSYHRRGSHRDEYSSDYRNSSRYSRY